MSDHSPSRAATSIRKLPAAKWGVACVLCASAKAKCIRFDATPGAKCDRCQWLLRDYVNQAHRPRKKRQKRPSRTAQIEERLNGLVDLLQASGDLSGRGPAEQSKRCICRPESGYAPPLPHSDDILLAIYRAELQPVFLFVIVPPDFSAATLLSVRPLLMSAIRMVASYRSLRSRRAQMYRLMAHIADHMLVRSERSLDLLQGIIVMLGWSQFNCFIHTQMNNLLVLSMNLIADLELNRPPVLREHTSLVESCPKPPSGRNNEERRALAAVWFLSSSLATNFSRIESMRYSPYLEACVKDLESCREYETDATLVFLVRIQHLTERIHERNLLADLSQQPRGIPTAPELAYIYALQNEVDRIRTTLPPALETHATMQLYLETAALRLYEPPPVDMAFVKQLSESLTTGVTGAGTPLDKIFQTSSTLRSWFDTWLSISVTTHFHMPMTFAAQMVCALTMLGRWAKLATPKTIYQKATPMPERTAHCSEMEGYRVDPKPPSLKDSNPGVSAPSFRRLGSRFQTLHATEPGLPAAVGALQSQLSTQPGLTVDIPEILSSVCSRLEQIDTSFRFTSVEPGREDNNRWNWSALKIRVTHVKLERWAELVSVGVNSCNRTSNSSSNSGSIWSGCGSGQPVELGIDGAELVQTGGLAQDQIEIQNYLDNTSWGSDLLDGIDPMSWFDGYLDWGAVIMNSKGTTEQ